MNGEDILFAMTSLGFENYSEALKIYLSKYREVGTRLHQRLSIPSAYLKQEPLTNISHAAVSIEQE